MKTRGLTSWYTMHVKEDTYHYFPHVFCYLRLSIEKENFMQLRLQIFALSSRQLKLSTVTSKSLL